MSGLLAITVGSGRQNPRGARRALAAERLVPSLAETLADLPSVTDGWWSANVFEGDHRQERNWRAAAAVMVDVDYHVEGQKKPTPPAALRSDLENAASDGKLPGNLFHHTPHGARLVFVLADAVTDPGEMKAATRGACAMVSRALAELGISGYEVDTVATDLARFMFSPRAIVDGEQRSAQVLVMGEQPYALADLPAPPPVALVKPTPSPRTHAPTEARDFDEAVRLWNADHPLDLPRAGGGDCFACQNPGGYGALPEATQRWFCWHNTHPDGVGIKTERGHHGDALDIAAHERGLSRADVLRADGYLQARREHGGIPEPPASWTANQPPAEPAVAPPADSTPPRLAVVLPLDEFRTFASRVDGHRQRRLEIGRHALSFGVSYLNCALGGIFPNDLILLGAKTGAGKTSLGTLVAMHNARLGKRVHYLALEAEEAEIEYRILYRVVVDAMYRAHCQEAVLQRLNYLDWYAGRLDDITATFEYQLEEQLREQYKTLRTFYRARDFGGLQMERLLLAVQHETDLIILDHLHYVDSDDPNENRGYKSIVKKIRDAALTIGKPVIVVAHVRKGERKAVALLPGLEDFHGSSDVPKISTKAIMIGRAPTPEATPRHLSPTYMQALKCRPDGSRTRYVGLAHFNARKNGYESEFQLGVARLAGEVERFEPVLVKDYPGWAQADPFEEARP